MNLRPKVISTEIWKMFGGVCTMVVRAKFSTVHNYVENLVIFLS